MAERLHYLCSAGHEFWSETPREACPGVDFATGRPCQAPLNPYPRVRGPVRQGEVDLVTTTWVPETEFKKVARCLDDRRLGAQRGEGLIVLRALTDRSASGAWTNHPAVRMWRGHERSLCEYGIAVCREWRARGWADQSLPKFVAVWKTLPGPSEKPPWWGEHRIHEDHRRTLLARLPNWYRQFWPDEEAREGYEWPA